MDMMSADELLGQALRYKAYWGDKGGITVSGGEPLLQMDFLLELFTKAKENGVHTVLDTSGNPFSRHEPFFHKFNRLMEVTDLLLLDIKEIDSKKHKILTGCSNENILDMAGYLAEIRKPVWIRHFPAMTAGPIVRYKDMKEQMKKRRVNALQLGYGARRFILGLAKKVLLADTLASLYGEISAGAGNISVLTAWIGMFAFTMEIYFDFSGYSDMAIGISRMLGFTVKENFDYPYMSKSVTEFWRRWHISLGSWFRDYIYIPLGGNRVGTGKHIRNILIVWCLTGMWHGAALNFPVWGLYYGVLLIAEKYILGSRLKKLPGWVSGTYTMLLVMIGWMLFSHNSLGEAVGYLGHLVGIGAVGLADTAALYYLKTNLVVFLLCILACRPGFYRWVESRFHDSIIGSAVLYGVLFLLGTACLVYSSYHPFLYLRF